MSKSITIIGGGPGGYVAAIRAAQLGAQVTLLENDTLGGTCVNRGCIPTKSLLHSVEIVNTLRNASAFGITTGEISIDFSVIAQRKEAAVQQLVAGIKTILKKKGVRVIKGTGTLVDSRTVAVLEQNEKITSDAIVVATGSKAFIPPLKGANQPGVMTSDEILKMVEFPKSVVIIGGGVVGLEFAQILHHVGSRVTIIEMMPRILPVEDEEITNMLTNILSKDGVEIIAGATVTDIGSKGQDEKEVRFTIGVSKQEQKRTGEKVLLASGRQPYTGDLGTQKVGIEVKGSRITTNKRMETSVPGIYSIGDVTGSVLLAHAAMEEGKCAVENIMGPSREVDHTLIPRCIYTSPEVAAVGLTEALARSEYGNVKIGRFPFVANGRALANGQASGMVKLIAESKYGQILGVHIIGANATELIAEAVLGMRLEATFEDIGTTIHAHPTMSEALMEAALGASGMAIHL